MNNRTLKILGVAVSAACLSLTISTAHATALVNFSNGAVADADDVNHNFNELATRIDNISNTTGATGPTGPQGMPGINGANGLNGLDGQNGAPGTNGQDGATGPAGLQGTPGINGTDGVGISTYSWQGYGNSAWSAKAFIKKDNSGYDKEVRTFDRTTAGITLMRRVRSDSTGTNGDKNQLLTFNYDLNGSVLLKGIDSYLSDGVTPVSQMTIIPGIDLRNNAMNLGMVWASSSQTDTTYDSGANPIQSFTVDSRSLLAVESITVQSVTYNNCYKILTNRTGKTMGGHFQRISWFCPNNVGLVKYIQAKETGYQVLEFDPNSAESALAQ